MDAWPATPFVHNDTQTPPSAVVAFLADVPALGTATYFVTQIQEARPATQAPVVPKVALPVVFDNGIIQATFDAAGQLSSIHKGGVSVNVSQSLQYYAASTGANDKSHLPLLPPPFSLSLLPFFSFLLFIYLF